MIANLEHSLAALDSLQLDTATAMNVLIFAEMWKLLPFLTLLLMASER